MATRKITIYNPDTDIAVELSLSVEDAIRAENDLQFATALMDSALKERATTTVGSHQRDADNPDHDNPNIEGQAQSAHQGEAVTSEESGLYRWTTEMVLFLLEMYVEREEKFSNGKFSQKKIWEEIVKAMKCRSPAITGPQCASKMRSLKKTYKTFKDHNNKRGNERRTWQFYEKMDTIFRTKAWASPVAVASSSGVSQRSQDDESEGSSDSFPSRKTKENVASLLKKRLLQKSKEEKARAKQHNERMEMDGKMLDLLIKLVDKQ